MPSGRSNIIAATGSMADQVRDYPWETTALGALETWGTAQCVAVNMVLTSSFPACLALGPELIMVYNDAFVPILGQKDRPLGHSFSHAWREAWQSIGPIAEEAMRGKSTFIEDYALEIERYGFRETAYFTFCYSPVFDEKGAVIGLLDTVFETTGKVLAEQKLQDFAASLALEVRQRTSDRDRMWSLSVDCMIITDTRSTILSVNPAFLRLFEWAESDVIGRQLGDFIHPDDLGTSIERWETAIRTDSVFRSEVRIRSKLGRYSPIDLSGAHHSGTSLLIGRDITAEREAEAQLKKTESALQQAQKIESLGRLTGGVAHDFNNLLQVIAGNLQLLEPLVRENERAVRWVSMALDSVTKGAKLSGSLLAFGRKQTLEPKVVNLGRTLDSMAEIMRRTLGDGLDVQVITKPGLWNTCIDEAQIENALLNLGINARDAMNGHGRLTIEVENAVLGQARVSEHDDLKAGEYVVLAVSDTGSGMSAHVLKQAFEPFFTTKAVGKGTGLGLSMVFGFVKQSGGHVRIDSEVGEGTTVKLYLPRSLEAEEKLASVDIRPFEGGTETILVVEDDMSVQATTVETLKQLGYKVVQANDASTALSIVQSGLHIDLLFTDVIMPGSLKSPELVRKATEILPGLAVLYTSGYTENAILHGGRLERGPELLGKPYSREALARRIRHALANGKQRMLASAIGDVPSLPVPATAAQPLRVLYVEDDELIRGMTQEMLEDVGFTVTAASTADQALKEDALGFDILVTDFHLGGITGEALALSMKEIHPDIAVVFTSGADHQSSIPGAKVIQKPFSIDQLHASIEEALAGRRTESED